MQPVSEYSSRAVLLLVYHPSLPPSYTVCVCVRLCCRLVDRFGPDCAERRAVRDFHFDQLQRLLLPPHTKFLLWLVHQPAEFFSVSSTEGSEHQGSSPVPAATTAGAAGQQQQLGISIWTLLCQEIGLSGDQAEKLRGQLRKVVGGPEFPRETWRLGVAAVYLQRLRAALETSARKLQLQYEALRAILTPAQLIRYCGWVERHRGRLGREAVEAVTVTGAGHGTPVPAQGAAGQGQGQANPHRGGQAEQHAGAAARSSSGVAVPSVGSSTVGGAAGIGSSGSGHGVTLIPASAWAMGSGSGIAIGGPGQGPHVPGAVSHSVGTGALSPLGI